MLRYKVYGNVRKIFNAHKRFGYYRKPRVEDYIAHTDENHVAEKLPNYCGSKVHRQILCFESFPSGGSLKFNANLIL